MTTEHIHALLVEDDHEDRMLICRMLHRQHPVRITVDEAEDLAQALQRLDAGSYDVVLLDLTLPDALGLESYERLRAASIDLPVVILSGISDEDLALHALRQGAQDYLLKGRVDAELLQRSLRYAIARQQLQSLLRDLALVDHLTRVYNRRGFFQLAEQQSHLANRRGTGLLVFLADVDGLKSINDAYGHGTGDAALQTVADLLRTSFRSSDLVARLGGDEFAALAIDVRREHAELIHARIRQQLEAFNRSGARPFQLSLSVGHAFLPSTAPPPSMQDLLNLADQAMYSEKRARADD